MKGTIWVDDEGGITRLTLDDPTGQALSEIGNPSLGQRDVAQTLALAMAWGQLKDIDWARVSAAAIGRWSRPGWRRIKTLAWTGRCWEHAP